jgi:uncharacterized membrane protein
VRKSLIIMAIVLSIIGFIDCLYLNAIIPQLYIFQILCGSRCGQFSLKILNVEHSFYGMCYYALLTVGYLYYFKYKNYIIYLFLLILSLSGSIFSIYLLNYQMTHDNGICYYCLLSFLLIVSICTITISLFKVDNYINEL